MEEARADFCASSRGERLLGDVPWKARVSRREASVRMIMAELDF